MKAQLTFSGIAFLALILATCTPASSPTSTAPKIIDTKASDRLVQLTALRAGIAGREEEPATEVFENITRLKNITAGRLLEVMDVWGKVLGVSCDFCHVPNEWASEVKSAKETTRQMFDLINEINSDLDKLQMNSISCYTCHRGDTHPETRPR